MLLEAHGIVKRYGTRTVLGGVDLEVNPGERVALLGPSGCGKSTLLNLLGGMDRPDSGSLIFQGEDLTLARPARLAELRRVRIGTIFQFFHLIPSLTARENVELPLRLLKRPRIRERGQELLDAVGMAPRSEAWPAELSGGELQRIAVARALAAAPVLLLADEPTGNLDREAGEAVLALLSSLSEREGAALVLVTHSASAAAICHRRLRLVDGQLQRES